MIERYLRFTRQYRTQLFLFSLVMFGLVLVACNLPAWIATANSILPIATEMALGIISLLSAFTGGTDAGAIATLNTVMTAIGKALTDVQNMVDEYNANPSTTLLGSIQAAIQAVIDSVKQLMTDTGITNTSLQSKVVDVLQLLLNEITAWSTMLPLLTAPAGTKFELIVPLDKNGLKQAYNAILSTPTGDVSVDAQLAKVKRL